MPGKRSICAQSGRQESKNKISDAVGLVTAGGLTSLAMCWSKNYRLIYYVEEFVSVIRVVNSLKIFWHLMTLPCINSVKSVLAPVTWAILYLKQYDYLALWRAAVTCLSMTIHVFRGQEREQYKINKRKQQNHR